MKQFWFFLVLFSSLALHARNEKLLFSQTRWRPRTGTLNKTTLWHDHLEHRSPFPMAEKIFNFTSDEAAYELACFSSKPTHRSLRSSAGMNIWLVAKFFDEKVTAFIEEQELLRTTFSCFFRMKEPLKNLLVTVSLEKDKELGLTGEVILKGHRKEISPELINLVSAALIDDPLATRIGLGKIISVLTFCTAWLNRKRIPQYRRLFMKPERRSSSTQTNKEVPDLEHVLHEAEAQIDPATAPLPQALSFSEMQTISIEDKKTLGVSEKTTQTPPEKPKPNAIPHALSTSKVEVVSILSGRPRETCDKTTQAEYEEPIPPSPPVEMPPEITIEALQRVMIDYPASTVLQCYREKYKENAEKLLEIKTKYSMHYPFANGKALLTIHGLSGLNDASFPEPREDTVFVWYFDTACLPGKSLASAICEIGNCKRAKQKGSFMIIKISDNPSRSLWTLLCDGKIVKDANQQSLGCIFSKLKKLLYKQADQTVFERLIIPSPAPRDKTSAEGRRKSPKTPPCIEEPTILDPYSEIIEILRSKSCNFFWWQTGVVSNTFSSFCEKHGKLFESESDCSMRYPFANGKKHLTIHSLSDLTDTSFPEPQGDTVFVWYLELPEKSFTSTLDLISKCKKARKMGSFMLIQTTDSLPHHAWTLLVDGEIVEKAKQVCIATALEQLAQKLATQADQAVFQKESTLSQEQTDKTPPKPRTKSPKTSPRREEPTTLQSLAEIMPEITLEELQRQILDNHTWLYPSVSSDKLYEIHDQKRLLYPFKNGKKHIVIVKLRWLDEKSFHRVPDDKDAVIIWCFDAAFHRMSLIETVKQINSHKKTLPHDHFANSFIIIKDQGIGGFNKDCDWTVLCDGEASRRKGSATWKAQDVIRFIMFDLDSVNAATIGHKGDRRKTK